MGRGARRPPCGTFSAARWNASGPGPPARSKTEIDGLSSDSSGLQRQADEGTLLATRSCALVAEVVKSQRARRVPEAGSIENPPPGSEGGPDGPMWMLQRWAPLSRTWTAVEEVVQARQVRRKAGRHAVVEQEVRLPGGLQTQQLVGKANRTERAAESPAELCLEYAKLMVKVWKRALDLEWRRRQMANKKLEVSALQLKWRESKEKQQQREQAGPCAAVKRSWGS